MLRNNNQACISHGSVCTEPGISRSSDQLCPCVAISCAACPVIIIIIIINFSQRHGLHKRLGLQTCSPEYKHTYIYNVAILQHTYVTNTTHIQGNKYIQHTVDSIYVITEQIKKYKINTITQKYHYKRKRRSADLNSLAWLI